VQKPPSASVHVGVKREKIPAAVDVRPRGQPPSWCPPCLVGRCINSSWRRARLGKEVKEEKEGTRRRTSRRVLLARMFACYYFRQIPTSRAADAHRSGSLARRRVISECIGMCIRKCLDSAFFEGWPSTPLTPLLPLDDAQPPHKEEI